MAFVFLERRGTLAWPVSAAERCQAARGLPPARSVSVVAQRRTLWNGFSTGLVT